MKALYKHKRTGNIYRLVGHGMFKYDGAWHKSVYYEHVGGDYPDTPYMRKTDDFFSNFEEVLDNGV